MGSWGKGKIQSEKQKRAQSLQQRRHVCGQRQMRKGEREKPKGTFFPGRTPPKFACFPGLRAFVAGNDDRQAKKARAQRTQKKSNGHAWRLHRGLLLPPGRGKGERAKPLRLVLVPSFLPPACSNAPHDKQDSVSNKGAHPTGTRRAHRRHGTFKPGLPLPRSPTRRHSSPLFFILHAATQHTTPHHTATVPRGLLTSSRHTSTHTTHPQARTLQAYERARRRTRGWGRPRLGWGSEAQRRRRQWRRCWGWWASQTPP